MRNLFFIPLIVLSCMCKDDELIFYTDSPYRHKIEAGSPVVLDKVDWEIGHIVGLELQPGPLLSIKLSVKSAYRDYIGQDSVAFLSLDPKYSALIIRPRSPHTKVLQPGYRIPCISQPPHYTSNEKPSASIDSSNEYRLMMNRVDAITKIFTDGDGPLPQLISSPIWREKINTIFSNLERLTAKLDIVLDGQSKNLDLFFRRDLLMLTKAAKNSIDQINNHIDGIAIDLKQLSQLLKQEGSDLVQATATHANQVLNELTRKSLIVFSDLSLLIRTVLHDLRVNADPLIKVTTARLADAAHTIIGVAEQKVIGIMGDLSAISKDIREILHTTNSLIHLSHDDIRLSLRGLADTLQSMDTLIQQISQLGILKTNNVKQKQRERSLSSIID